MNSERNWIQDLQHGSPDALQAIYRAYKDDLLSLGMFLLRDLPRAEDTLHDVFLRLVEHPPKLRHNTHLKSYLAACVANRARDVLRQDDRRKQHGKVSYVPLLERISKDSSPESNLEDKEEGDRVRKAMLEMPAEQSEVVAMHLFGSMTFKQISRCLEVSQNTIQSRYRYGMEKLRSLLETEHLP